MAFLYPGRTSSAGTNHQYSMGSSSAGVFSLSSPHSLSPTCVADITGSISHHSHAFSIGAAAAGAPRSHIDCASVQQPRRHNEAKTLTARADIKGGNAGAVSWPSLETAARQNYSASPAFAQERLICGVAPPATRNSNVLKLVERASRNASISSDSINGKPKFEMCKFVLQGRTCPYQNARHHGRRCAFAHSDSEMVRDYSTLAAYGRVEDVLLDRNLPCMEALMTGTCPFGDHTGSGPSRCTRLHDPKWMANNLLGVSCSSASSSCSNAKNNHRQTGAAWLQHREMPCTKFIMQNQNTTDIPVNSAYHLMRDVMYEGGQLMRACAREEQRGQQEMCDNVLFVATVKSKQWNDSSTGTGGEAPYVVVQSFSLMASSAAASSNHLIPELPVLAIAVEMHHNPANPKENIFTYQPSHVLEGQPCMVLASSPFVIQGVRHHVQKIAFGPAGKDLTSGGHKIPPVALWFDLTPAELIANPHQAKENHKAWGGEKLSPQAANLLSRKLGIVEHYHYDTHVSQSHLDLMSLRLRQLQHREGGTTTKKHQELFKLERQSLDLQFKAVQAKLNCSQSLKRFHEISSVSLCQDRSGAESAALIRPDCAMRVDCKSKTKRGQKHVTRFLKSFEATMDIVSPSKSAWHHRDQHQQNNDSMTPDVRGALSSLVHKIAAYRGIAASNGAGDRGLLLKLPTLHQARHASFAADVSETPDSAWESWRRSILHPEYETLLHQHQHKHQHHHNNNNAQQQAHHPPRPVNNARRATATSSSNMIYNRSYHQTGGSIAA
jgi:hypothetical protein